MRAFAGVLCPMVVAAILVAPGFVKNTSACPRWTLPDDDASRARLRAWLDTWWGADVRARREAVQQSWLELEYLTRILDDPEHDMHAFAAEAVEGLVQVEPDDFVLSSLLDSFLRQGSDRFRPVFRDALSHDSPNVRRRALQWFARHHDPDPEVVSALERLWRIESAPWNRANLIGALACQGSPRHLDDLLRMAGSDDTAFASIAVRALGAFDDWRIIPLLKSLLRSGPEDVRDAAVSALAAIPDSAEAREIVTGLAREGDSGLRSTAIREITAWPGGDATSLLLELASSSAIPVEDRQTALTSVWFRDHPDVTETLRGIAEGPSLQETSGLRESAEMILETRENVDIDKIAKRNEARPDICRFEIRNLDPHDPDTFRVRSEPGLASVRCWSSPGLAGPPAGHPRIPEGDTVHPWDVYEGPELWVQVSTNAALCWVPRSSLAPVEADDEGDDDEGPIPDEDGRVRVELDVAPETLGSAGIVELRDAGVAEVIDPAPDVVGLALAVDLDDVEAMRRLLGYSGLIDEAFDRTIERVASLAEEHSERSSDVVRLLERFFETLDDRPEPWE